MRIGPCTRSNGTGVTSNAPAASCSSVEQRSRSRKGHSRQLPKRQSCLSMHRSCQLRSNILTVLVVLISLLSGVSARSEVQTPRSFADLGARRLIERAGSTTEASKTTSTTTVASATTTVLPQAFDTTIGNNFTTDSCPNFFTSFLQDADFVNCYAVSLLLQAEKNFFQITNVLQAGCNVDYNFCNAKMQELAIKLKTDDACGQDYVNENQIVMQAYNGMLAYSPMYQAACLKDTKGNYYAITLQEGSSLADAYLYYLPLGTAMGMGTRPSCNPCLKDTMAVLRTYASNNTQPVSNTYTAAAQQINMACGPEWVSDSIETTNGSPRTAQSSIAISLTIAVAVLLL